MGIRFRADARVEIILTNDTPIDALIAPLAALT